MTQPGNITNLAVKTGGNEPDPNPGNDSGAATINAAAAADVAVMKTADNTTPSVGQNVTFTVTAANRGPSDATGIEVEDALPAGLALVSATPSMGNYDAATGIWTVGDLTASTSATLTVLASVNTTGTLVNEARKTAQTEIDPNPLNDDASVSLNAGTSADIDVGKTISTASPPVGSQVTFTVTATNHGPSPATGVVVTDQLPAGFSFVSATASQGTYDENAGTWAIGNLPATGTALLSITARVTALTPFTNTASRTTGNEPDPNPANDSSSVSGTTALIADLSITKTDNQTLAIPGAPLTYTITVQNAGPSDVAGAPVSDPFPPPLSGASWSCIATPGGSCGAPSGTGPIATTVDLPAGGAATFTATATVQPDATGTVTNTASVRAPAGTVDPDPTNDDATDSSDLTTAANLGVTKSGPASALPGQTVSYTIVVSNAGPSTASDVLLSDPTPPGLAFVSNSGDCMTAFPCALGTIAPSGSRTIVATYTVLPDATQIVNSATVASSTPDPDPSDNTGGATTEVGPVPPTDADLEVSKVGTPASAASGTQVTYTLTVMNHGPAAASNVVLTDSLPAGVQLVSATAAAGACTGSNPVTCTARRAVQRRHADSDDRRARPAGRLRDAGRHRDGQERPARPDPDEQHRHGADDRPGAGRPPPHEERQPGAAEERRGSRLHAHGDQRGPVEGNERHRGRSAARRREAGRRHGEPGDLHDGGPDHHLRPRRPRPERQRDGDDRGDPHQRQRVQQHRDGVGHRVRPESRRRHGDRRRTRPDAGELRRTASTTTATASSTREDPACCTAQSLTFTQARFRPGKSTLQATATLASGALAGIDPRTQDVRVQVRTDAGEQVCCTIASQQWQKLFHQTYGFFDQKMTLCPPLKCVRLIVPKSGPAKAIVILGRVKPGGPLLSPTEITIEAGNQCVSGQLTLQPKGKRGAGFP